MCGNTRRGMTPPSKLVVEGLSCRRGHRELFSGLQFSLWPGQALQVTGENGAGKTTLLKTLCGLRRPAAGRVFWGDTDIHAQPDPFGQALLYIGHDNALNPDLTPFENLAMLQRLSDGQGELAAALAEMGLHRGMRRPCRALSAGQRRRVALARLRLGNAPLWILDEPAAALDVTARELLAGIVSAHVTGGGMVVYTTHEPLPLVDITPSRLELQP